MIHRKLIGQDFQLNIFSNLSVIWGFSTLSEREPCVMASDPQECVAALCDPQGCFPTIQEAIQAFLGLVQYALDVLGQILSVLIGIISFLLKPLLPQSVGQTQEGNNGTITEV
ncbi:MAG TPA: hypothetical protein DEG17_19430 [Cyanobacteria bacterium UBA11149]|nr:hypothetical protein [Cyanobacteria bacterium UBA11366]HBR73614.1 hypothetical protein [Cyanobacteria bacterium UBA11159]HBS70205.1 hypothetical protein [Cyanobacteria bacterium UBA11153]HBW90975.1 hypothetical protein [Cyanobacteria bacterium UBA11149]HCA94999.1 hypothetical protein [Cyanobacteria bacterium UBA9226]